MNRKAFGASFLYWVDFMMEGLKKLRQARFNIGMEFEILIESLAFGRPLSHTDLFVNKDFIINS